MKTLVVYHSAYGNTEKVARAIAAALGEEARAVEVTDLGPTGYAETELIIIGAPTQGGRPTPPVAGFIKKLDGGVTKSASFAVFDTRIPSETASLPLKLLLRIIGYAAPKMASSLKAKGARLIAPPEGFIVLAKEGPLKDGELERAEHWARSLPAALQARQAA